jgi:SRSO17 transposase
VQVNGLSRTWHICRKVWDTQIARLGKQDNCQVAVRIALACKQGSIPLAWQFC